MPVSTGNIINLERTFDLTKLVGDDVKLQARQLIDQARKINRQELSWDPKYAVYIEGRKTEENTHNLTTWNPTLPHSPVVVAFEVVSVVAKTVLDFIARNAPVKSGDYFRSFKVQIDRVKVLDDALMQPESALRGDLAIIYPDIVYGRMIENSTSRRRHGFAVDVLNRAARAAKRKHRGADVYFTFSESLPTDPTTGIRGPSRNDKRWPAVIVFSGKKKGAFTV